MSKPLKVGIQNLHLDELNALSALLDEPNVQIYSWKVHDFDQNEIQSCDLLILFARRHWKYIKFNKPYVLILADYVTNQKALDLTKSRSFNLFKRGGYSYTPNNLFKGFLCGSIELFETIRSANIPGFFYHKKYPFAAIFESLKQKATPDAKAIVTLINSYQRTAGERKWRKPENSYEAYQYVAQHTRDFQFSLYGAPGNQISFDQSNEVQATARYTIHVKYWGHVCNAVVKSLALGTPVIMDQETFNKGRYRAYIRHGENGLVFKTKDEIVKYLNSAEENATWLALKKRCVEEAKNWHFPYSQEEKNGLKKLLHENIGAEF